MGYSKEVDWCRDCLRACIEEKYKIRLTRGPYNRVCARCGVTFQVPFAYTDNRPVYCSECFAAMHGRE